MDAANRYRGCLLGLAVADAVGTTLEFTHPGTFTPITGMVGGGPFNLKPGQWTDDTSMALCLAESLIECQGFNPTDQMQRYVRWWQQGYLSSTGTLFDIGGTVRSALAAFVKSGNPYSGSSAEYSAGNGSIMRLAPVPMFYSTDPVEAIQRSADSSRVTHGEQRCVDACRYLGGLLVGALAGVSKDELLSDRYSPVKDLWKEQPLQVEVDQVAAGFYRQKNPPEIRGSGYVVQSLEAALWAFYHSTTFADGCLLAANLGEDADTTAAVYGQIAGAYYGDSAIPADWLEPLAMRELIKDYAVRLMRVKQPEKELQPGE